jgi:hypothetical protein
MQPKLGNGLISHSMGDMIVAASCGTTSLSIRGVLSGKRVLRDRSIAAGQ